MLITGLVGTQPTWNGCAVTFFSPCEVHPKMGTTREPAAKKAAAKKGLL